jgi:hypothetical protein
MASGFRKTVLTIQQLFIDDGAENVRTVKVPQEHLEPGIERFDLCMEGWHGNAQWTVKRDAAVTLLDSKFKLDGSKNFWEGYSEGDDENIVIGLDNDSAGLYISVERQTDEFLKHVMGERKVEKSFKNFLIEARKAGVNIDEEKTKGVVTKLIATLEGNEAGQFTKVARQYHSILKALKKLEAKKDELNASLKDTIGTTFDAELDKFTTRVVQSAKFAATLAKETPPEDVKEKVEVNYELLVEGLMKLLTDDLKPAAEKLLEGATKRWKPDPRSPNLSVKALDEGVMDTLGGWYRAAKEFLQKAYARFDKNLASLEKQLTKYKARRLSEGATITAHELEEKLQDVLDEDADFAVTWYHEVGGVSHDEPYASVRAVAISGSTAKFTIEVNENGNSNYEEGDRGHGGVIDADTPIDIAFDVTLELPATLDEVDHDYVSINAKAGKHHVTETMGSTHNFHSSDDGDFDDDDNRSGH